MSDPKPDLPGMQIQDCSDSGRTIVVQVNSTVQSLPILGCRFYRILTQVDRVVMAGRHKYQMVLGAGYSIVTRTVWGSPT
jgi:hypothetical protein